MPALSTTCDEISLLDHKLNAPPFLRRNEKGEWLTLSFGGYHVDDDDRTVLQADSQGGPIFRSSPIDVYACDVGE